MLVPHRHVGHSEMTPVSLPEFMNFKLFGNTILVVNKKFGFCGPSTQQVITVFIGVLVTLNGKSPLA